MTITTPQEAASAIREIDHAMPRKLIEEFQNHCTKSATTQAPAQVGCAMFAYYHRADLPAKVLNPAIELMDYVTNIARYFGLADGLGSKYSEYMRQAVGSRKGKKLDESKAPPPLAQCQVKLDEPDASVAPREK